MLGYSRPLCLIMLSWIFTDEFWLRVRSKAVMTQCWRLPAVLMIFFTYERCEHHCKALLFFYQLVSAYLMSEVISKTAVKQYVPLDTNHYLPGPSSSLTFIFTIFQVSCSLQVKIHWKKNPIIGSHPMIEEIVPNLPGNYLGRPLSVSAHLSIYLSISGCQSMYLLFFVRHA